MAGGDCGGGTVGGGGTGAVQVKHFECHFMRPHKRYSVCTCTVCLGRSLLYQSLLDSVLIMDLTTSQLA